MELLPDMGVDADTVAEMDKDVRRLETIASRFSKIGSVPKMEDADLGTMVDHATSYMSTRISPNIKVKVDRDAGALPVEACPPLLGWVMETL